MRCEVMAWTMAWEGCFSIHKISTRPGFVMAVSVDNTDKDLIDNFYKLVGYGKIYVHRKYHGVWKDLWKWQLTDYSSIKKFCEEILPFLPAKKEQAQLIIGFCSRRLAMSRKGLALKKGANTWVAEDFQTYYRMKELNKRGKLCSHIDLQCKEFVRKD